MINIPLIVIILVIFSVMITSYSIHYENYVAISLLGCLLAGILTGLNYQLDLDVFIGYINFQAIIILIAMNIIIKIAQDSKILEYITIKLFQISKGKRRLFFYLLCLITMIFSSIISGIIVVLVLTPMIIRICRLLRIKAGTFLLGMTLCVNIGSILTPWKNIIISTHFNLNSLFFIQNLWFISIILLFLIIFIIDYFWLSKESDINKKQKKLVLEFINAEVIIENKKMFYLNSIALILIFILLIFLPFIYLTAAIGALLLVLVNQKFHKNQIKEIFKDIEWEFIFFFIASYVIIGCLLEVGFKEIFNLIQFEQFSNFLILVILTIFVVIVISFLPDTPTALIFIPIIEVLVYDSGFPMVPLLITFLLAFNIGGNLLPQGSAADMLTLELADKYHVVNLNFKKLLKVGGLITIFHLVLIIGYVYIFSLIFY